MANISGSSLNRWYTHVSKTNRFVEGEDEVWNRLGNDDLARAVGYSLSEYESLKHTGYSRWQQDMAIQAWINAKPL